MKLERAEESSAYLVLEEDGTEVVQEDGAGRCYMGMIQEYGAGGWYRKMVQEKGTREIYGRIV